MKIKKEENTYIVSLKKSEVKQAVENFKADYEKLKDKHIIVDLSKIKINEALDLIPFVEISTQHKMSKKSFVMLTDAVDIDKVPEELAVAPTLQEAYDIIEMEDIERDLGF